MKRTPCEYIVWHELPVIRKEIAESMINDYGLNQRQAAKKLGISPAAISQYLSGKRAKTNISDRELHTEISISAKRIIKKGEEALVLETCRLCKILNSKNFTPFNKIGENHEIL